METTSPILLQPEPLSSPPIVDGLASTLFSQQRVTLSKQEHVELIHQINYWKAQHAQAKQKIEQLQQHNLYQAGRIKDLQNRVFGKSSEKSKRSSTSEKARPPDRPKKPRGQQANSKGHGRTARPELLIIEETQDLPEQAKKCATCGLAHRANPALDEVSEVIEVEVAAHTRRIHRPAYMRHPGCRCPQTAPIITAPPTGQTHSPQSLWRELVGRGVAKEISLWSTHQPPATGLG